MTSNYKYGCYDLTYVWCLGLIGRNTRTKKNGCLFFSLQMKGGTRTVYKSSKYIDISDATQEPLSKCNSHKREAQQGRTAHSKLQPLLDVTGAFLKSLHEGAELGLAKELQVTRKQADPWRLRDQHQCEGGGESAWEIPRTAGDVSRWGTSILAVGDSRQNQNVNNKI